MLSLSATPYVPGRASGVLRFGPAAAAAGVIVALHQHEIGALRAWPAAIILVNAAPFSHPALRLLSQAIPAVLMEQDQLGELMEGEELVLDGHSGLVASPALAALPEPAPAPPPEAGRPVASLDGAEVQLRASIGTPAAGAAAVGQGAAAIGLVRTEYLFPEDGSRPDVDFLAAVFEQICQAARPLPVSFRLVDIAGDKRPPWLGRMPGAAGVLGLQGVRLYSWEPVRQVYLDELKALGRLAGQYRLEVLLPYVAHLAELETRVAEIRQYLPPTVRIGTMLETPAAALAVDEFLQVADFSALGCNDLMQCLFAADRDVPELRTFLDPHAPALFRFLASVADRADSKLGALQVCGLLPQWQGILPVLLGLGYRIFSVDPVMIPWLAQTVRQTDTKQAAQLARAVCEARRSEEVRQLLDKTNSPA